jgi:hypothetical protein
MKPALGAGFRKWSGRQDYFRTPCYRDPEMGEAAND